MNKDWDSLTRKTSILSEMGSGIREFWSNFMWNIGEKIAVLAVILVACSTIWVVFFLEDMGTYRNGHKYVKIGLYSYSHDPDCSCYLKGEKR